MSNSRFSEFNQEFNETIQISNSKDRHITPKCESKYNFIYYLHFSSEQNNFGHYCLNQQPLMK